MAMQHIYARTERGLYSGGPGYDTVQVTEGLSKDFVQRHIHPYCFYKEPCFADEEKNIMPDVYFMTPIGSAREALLFGRNIYKVGIRNSFLSHGIVIDEKKELQDAYNRFDAVIGYDRFLREPITAELSTISISDVKVFDMFYTRDLFFQLLGIKENVFKSVLYSIIQAYFDKKQLYIKLNAQRSICSEAARQLMRYIFEALPGCLRGKIGYISYSPVLPSPVFFNIVFLDKKVELTDGFYGNLLDLTKDTFSLYDNRFLQNAWKNINDANKILLGLRLDCKEPVEWRELNELAKAEKREWRNLGNEMKLTLGEHNYFYLLQLVTDLHSYEMYDNTLFMMQQYKSSNNFFEKTPDIEELEYLFHKEPIAIYFDLAYFGEYSLFFYGEMFNKLRNTDGKFHFLAMARFYINGVNKYFNQESYAGLTKRLCDTMQELFEEFKDETADTLTERMQEVIIGEISVYLRKS